MKIRIFFVSFLYIFVFLAMRAPAQSLSEIQQQLTNWRTGLYTNATPISPDQLYTLYERIQEAKSEEQKHQLTALWGILWAENSLIVGQSLTKNQTFEVTQIYQKHKKSLKNATPDVLQKTAEWCFTMIHIFPKKRHSYLMDMRTFLMKSLWQDQGHIASQISLGKWWAYRIIRSKNREMNHTIAQSKKYLASKFFDSLIQNSPDLWTRIDIFNAYRMRSALRLKTLETQRAFEDFSAAKKILPNHHKGFFINSNPSANYLIQVASPL